MIRTFLLLAFIGLLIWASGLAYFVYSVGEEAASQIILILR